VTPAISAITLYAGTPLLSGHGSPIAEMENKRRAGGDEPEVRRQLPERRDAGGARARAGFSTAVIGKLGPTRIQDSTAAADGKRDPDPG